METTICTKTLYNYIDKEIFLNITNKDLSIKRKKRKEEYHKVRIALKSLKGTSIEERPKNIKNREEYGHWEMNCVVGKGVLEGCAIAIISGGETYGYEITRSLNTLGFTDVVDGTVYTILVRTEKK